MPGPESDHDGSNQPRRLDTQADFDDEFASIAAAQEGSPLSQPESDSRPAEMESRRATRNTVEVSGLHQMKQDARGQVKAAYSDTTDPADAPRVPRETKVAETASIQQERDSADSRLAGATMLMQEAARDPAKVVALYEQGRSDDPEVRATAAIALAGVKLERRAERAEQLGAGTARASATSLRNLEVLATSEQMRGILTHGGEVPRVPKRQFWQFWRP